MSFLKMNLITKFFKPNTKVKIVNVEIVNNDQQLIDVLSKAPKTALSLLNKQVELTAGLSLPVAEALLIIGKMDLAVKEIDPSYTAKINRTQQWLDLYKITMAYLTIKSAGDEVLQARYHKVVFEPTIKKILGFEVDKPSNIGPRKVSKVKFLEFAKNQWPSPPTTPLTPVKLFSLYAIENKQ